MWLTLERAYVRTYVRTYVSCLKNGLTRSCTREHRGAAADGVGGWEASRFEGCGVEASRKRFSSRSGPLRFEQGGCYCLNEFDLRQILQAAAEIWDWATAEAMDDILLRSDFFQIRAEILLDMSPSVGD